MTPDNTDVVVTVVSTEDLTPALREAVIDVCIAAHDEADFRNLFSYIPSGGRHVVAERDGAIVGHAVATTRWLQTEGSPLMRTAFVDAVSTLPSMQGTGIGSAVMRRLAAAIDDYEIGCLNTDKVAFYARLGWELWRGPLAGRTGDGLVPTPDERDVMILRLPGSPPLDLDALLTIERQPARFWN
ncbi:MAG TPA: GNAT family N-acetyltransferase [Ilumatobacteraceae bacterium]